MLAAVPGRRAVLALAGLLAASAPRAAEPGSPTDVASRFYAALHRFDAEAVARGLEAGRYLGPDAALAAFQARAARAAEEAPRPGERSL